MAQKLGDNHHAPTAEAGLRLLRIRLRTRPECAAFADETAVVRADLRKKRDDWEDAVDEVRAATADVQYKDARLDGAVKVELKAAVGAMVAAMPAKQREATTKKLYGGKSPSEGMKNVGGPVQDHYVDAILTQLGTPEFAPLGEVAAKITTLRAELSGAETTRMTRRSAEQLVRSALEDATEAARRFYNQMQARLALLLPDDPDFIESCFLDLRAVAPDQGVEARKRALVAVYRARHGAVPRELAAALDEKLDEARFGTYVELFATKSAEEIAAVVVPKEG